MKKSYSNVRFIAVFFAATLLFTSCTQYDDSNVIRNTEENLSFSKINNFSGEEIFKGIFFLNEDFGSQIEILNNSILYEEINKNNELQKNLDVASALIVNEINKYDSSFFDNFKKMMQSRNEYQIAAAIQDGSKMLIEISNLIFKENDIDEKTLSSIIASGDYQKVVDDKGNLDKSKLNEYLSQVDDNVNISFNNSTQNGKCLAAAVVTVAFFVAAGAVLVAGAIAIIAAINGGVLINLGAAVAVYVEIATPKRKTSNLSGNLGVEILVSQIAGM